MKKRLLTLALALMLAMASLAMLASCDLSGLTGGGGTTCTSHKDENKDHKCDTCEKVLTTCADTDKDHKCDLCGKALSECKDEDGDHACDLCEKTLGTCEDKNNDHKCDICEEVLTACADTDNDHKCDTCDETLSQCADGDTDGRCDICGEAMIPAHTCEDSYPKDHKCDVCDKKLSEHTDQNNDHRCDHCYNRATYCADADNDHACDICTEVKTSCMDGDNNGVCDICGETVTVTEGADGSALRTENLPFAGCYGIAATNTATDFSGSTLYFLPGLDSYRFYLFFSFELDDLVFTDGAEYGSFVSEEGYIKDGRFVVPVTYTPNGTQLCTEIGVQYMQFTKRATGQTNYLTRGVHLRFVLNCVVPSFLGVSADGNYANASDTVTINFTDIVNAPAEGFYIYLHFDNQVGGGRIHGNNLNNYRNYALYEDGIYTLKCELNAAQIGSHKPIITFSYIPASIGLAGIVDLYNTFTLVVEPGTPCAECSENKQYPDGHCDTCGNPLPPCDHTDTDKDHKCDLCTETISQCADEDGDHFCDLCEERRTYCYDRTGDHLCDLCNERLACNDANRDHKCDICEEKLSDCFDNACDGICDWCEAPIESIKTYEQILAELSYDDSALPVWRVAISCDYAPYTFVNRGLKKGEWFVGSEVLLAKYLARELGYRIEFVPMTHEGSMLCAARGAVDCAINALHNGFAYDVLKSEIYHSAKNPSNESTDHYVVFLAPTKEDDLAKINAAIEKLVADGLYEQWFAAAEAYADTMHPQLLDIQGYEDNGIKIGGDEDLICIHKNENGDHHCDLCGDRLTWCTDENTDGTCDICSNPTKSVYEQYLKDYTFNDDNCPVLRVAVCTDYAPYLFVNRGLARDEWFCGADALMIRYLAKSLGYKIEYVPLSREACITAIRNGEADCAIGALRDGLVYEFRESLSYHYAENPITGYQEYFHIYCSEETMQDLVYDINDLIFYFREDENSLYKSWVAAAEAYIDTLPPLHLDDKGYDANGNKIGGNEDLVCPHTDAVIDHYCDACHTLLNYYVDDIGHNGICDICNEPLTSHSKDAVGPSFVGLSYTPDGTYNDNGRIFFHSKATTTVYLKFTKPVTMQPLTLNNHAITFAEYSHTEDEYIVSATFTINTFNLDGAQPCFEWKDFFGKKHSKIIGVYRIPEFAGAAENGTITSGPLTFTEGASFVVQLATAGQAEITALYIGDTELTFSLGNVQSIQVSIPNYGSTHGNLYTLTVTDGAHVPYGESEITVRYKVAGTPSGDGAPFSDFKITVNKKKAISEEATKDTYLSLLEALQQANNATAEWRVAIAPELAPYLFSDLSLATDDWFVGAEILFIHRLAYEMNYRVVLVPLSKEGCITALKNGMADAAIGCFTAEEKNALGVLSSQAYTAIIDPAAIAPTELFVLVAANKENDLSMIDKAIDFIQSEGAYDTWLAAAQSYVDASEAEDIDEYGYYADGKKIDASGVCKHEDENGDHICDNCGFEGMFCEDGDYDGYCDSCYLPIAGADLLMNPSLVGYGTDPTEGFFEALGMIELKHGVATTLYLKFNCEVKDFSVLFPSGEAASTHYYTDLTGAVYRIEIPAFDHIFPQGETEFLFATDYAESSAIISYSCLPDPMPEYLGAMVNGALNYDTVSVKQGESATVQFAMNVAVNLDYLSLDGNYLEISEWESELVTDGNESYYLYTVTFSLQDISADEFELGIKYSYLGASTEGFDGMLPMFAVRVSVSRYVLLGATVNGNDVLNSTVQIPYSTSYEILLSVNQSADAIRLATEVGVLEGELFSEQGFFVYRFTVPEFSMSYVTAQVLAVSGNTELLFGALSFEILAQTGGEGGEGSEGGEGGEGGGGMTEVRIPNIIEIYDCVNEISLQEKDILYIWADGKLSIRVTYDIPVAESHIKWNDMIYTAEIAPGENSYYYTVAMPMSASKEEGTFRLCFYENEIWSEPYEFSYKKEAAAFYGIYTEPLVPDIDNPSSFVYLPEGQPATVYLAMTAAVEPMELYIAGIDYPIDPLYSPWQEGGMTFTDDDGDPIHIWFYTVELPAEVMSSEYETIKLAFLQADPDPAGYYDNIYETYSISIVPAV